MKSAVVALPLWAISAVSGTISAESDPAAFQLVALDAANALLVFRSDSPQDARRIKITGADGGFIGVDVRPMDGSLYGLTDVGTIHVIDVSTGAARLVSRLGSPFDGGAASGFDFNPQSDRLRLIAMAGQNLRVNVEIGAVAIDGPLAYASADDHAGKRPQVTATAYTNAVARARSTETFDIDSGLDLLVRQDPPNEGILESVGPLGVDCGEAAGFDIATDGRGRNHAFLVCDSTLYRLELASGAAREIGPVGNEIGHLIGLAVLPAPQ